MNMKNVGLIYTYIYLQRLRNENRLLKKQNELLEAESTELAHRLVRGQVSRAEDEETSFAIQSELLALRRSHLEISHQLETANEEVRGLSLRLQENVSNLRFAYKFYSLMLSKQVGYGGCFVCLLGLNTNHFHMSIQTCSNKIV